MNAAQSAMHSVMGAEYALTHTIQTQHYGLPYNTTQHVCVIICACM
jgi:hypothetical protein